MSEGFFKYVSLKGTLFSKLSHDRDGRLMLGSTVMLIVPRRVFSASEVDKGDARRGVRGASHVQRWLRAGV